MNAYEILNVDYTATISDIKKAYRKLALKYHPDKYEGSSDKFKSIHDSYEKLCDVEGRIQYDLTLEKITKDNAHELEEKLKKKTREDMEAMYERVRKEAAEARANIEEEMKRQEKKLARKRKKEEERKRKDTEENLHKLMSLSKKKRKKNKKNKTSRKKNNYNSDDDDDSDNTDTDIKTTTIRRKRTHGYDIFIDTKEDEKELYANMNIYNTRHGNIDLSKYYKIQSKEWINE